MYVGYIIGGFVSVSMCSWVLVRVSDKVKRCTNDIRCRFESANAQISEFQGIQQKINRDMIKIERRIQQSAF